jgi:hypothetical protein
VLHFLFVMVSLIISRFAYYTLQFARLTLRGRQGRLLAAPASLFGGCVRARQGTKKSAHDVS